MGFFSWTTADSKESINNIYSGHSNAGRTVFLLQPNGASPIREDTYEGYGEFGSVDAYVWLCDANMPEKKSESEEWRRSMGICLDIGNIYMDVKTSKYYSFHYHELDERIHPFKGTYADVQAQYGKTPNELIEEGIWTEVPGRQFFLGNRSWYPLKFSFDEKAVYEDLPASEMCPNQGYF